MRPRTATPKPPRIFAVFMRGSASQRRGQRPHSKTNLCVRSTLRLATAAGHAQTYPQNARFLSETSEMALWESSRRIRSWTMQQRYRLHYAPDNASLVIRLALLELGVPFETVLVDRTTRQQDSEGYRSLNPNGLIPVLEGSDGAIFETAAILLWLADRHCGLAPAPDSAARADFLKWLFFASNTLHADLRQLFYAGKYIGPDADLQAALRTGMKQRLSAHLNILDQARASAWPDGDCLSVLDIYLSCQLRWMALYPADQDRSWFDLTRYPALHAMAARLETRDSTRAAITAEGLGDTPFTRPSHPTPPEGSAT